jgi:hypothetical protein
MFRNKMLLMLVASSLCSFLSYGIGFTGFGPAVSKCMAADLKLEINMTEEQVIELMRNNAEVVGIIQGNVHTYKIKGSNYSKVMGGEYSLQGDAEFFITVNFTHGRVASINTVRNY